MKSNSLKVWLGVAVTTLVVSGCDCNNSKPPAVQCDKIQVNVTAPGTVTDPMVTVTGTVVDGDGKAFTDISTATACAHPTGGSCDGKPGTVSDNKLTFDGVALSPGVNVIDVVVTRKSDATCIRRVSVNVTYTMNTNDGGMPSVSCVGFPQDRAADGGATPDGVLNSIEVPVGSQLTIDASSNNLNGGTMVVLDLDNGNAVISQPNAGPILTVPNTTSDGFSGVKHFRIQGTVMGTGQMVTADCSAVTFDRTAPSCSVMGPAAGAVLGALDDADSNTPGYQVSTSAQTNNKATEISLSLSATLNDGGSYLQTSGYLPVSGGGLAAPFTIDATGTTSYSVIVQARDSAGNVCSTSSSFTADFDAPTVTILAPDAGDTFTVLDVPVSAFVQDRLTDGGVGPAQGSVLFTVTQGGSSNIAMVAIDDGGFAVTQINAFAGADNLTAVGTDLAKNASPTAGPVPFTVLDGATGCSISFLHPVQNDVITASQLVGGIYNVQGTSTCPMQTVTLSVNGVMAASGMTSSGGGILLPYMPVDGVNEMWTLSIGTSSSSVTVTVATTAPSINQPANNSVLNVARDLDPMNAGVQTTLSFTAPGASALCVSANLTGALGACPDGMSGWFVLQPNVTSPQTAFTFPDGPAPTYAYSIRVVYGMGAGAVSSSAVALVVDSVRPVVSNYKLVGDTNNDNMLNASELAAAGGTPKLTFDVTGDSQATIDTRIVVQNTAGSVVYNSNAADVWSNSNVVVPLDQNIAAEGNYTWNIVVTDEAGNANAPLPVLSNYRIDNSPPTCALTLPVSNSLLNISNDADPVASGWQLRARVAGSADVATVAIGLNGSQTDNQPAVAASGGSAQYDFTLTSASGGTYGVTSSCTDVAGNTTAATPVTNVTVDLQAPTCTITAPANGSTSGTFANLTTISSDAIGQPVTVLTAVGGGQPAQVGVLTVQAGGTASGSLTYPNGAQSVTATVQDPAGNSATCPAIAFTVNAVGCDIAFTQPAINGSTGIAYLNQTVTQVIGHTSCGAGKTVALYNVVSGNPTQLAMGSTNASGDVTLSPGLPDGTGYTLRLTIDNGAGVLSSVDLTPVTIDTVAPAVGGPVAPANVAQLYFVAAADNYNVQQGTAGYIADLVPGGNADVHVTVNNITGANGGKVVVMYGGAQVGSQNITADPFNASLSVTLNQNTSGLFEIQVSDSAGNLVKPTSAPAAVDVIAPAAPTVTPTLSDARAAKVNLGWGPVYDDGTSSASGAVAAYDLRWSTAAVANNNNLATATDYFDGTKANKESDIAWSAGTISHDLFVPPMTSYFIVVRAKDEVGNYSPYVAPSAFANPGTQDTLTNPSGTANQGFGSVIAAHGSIDGDAVDDLVVGARSARSAYVYFGSASFGSTTTCSLPACQTIALPGTNTGDNFGADVSVGDLGGTATGASAPDVVVASFGFNATQGRVFIFFGGANPIDTSNFIEIRGTASGALFGRSAQVIPDINGDGVSELAVAAPNESGFQGHLYIFKGRTIANWQAAETATDGMGVKYMPAASADWVIDGPLPVDTASLTGNQFGTMRNGFTKVGDLNGDGVPEFAFPAAKDSLNRCYIWSGQTVASAAGHLTSGDTVANPDQSLQRLTATPFSNGSGTQGFGAAAFGGLDVINGTGLDLLVGYPEQAFVNLYADGISTGYGSPALTFTGTNLLGVSISGGDFSGDGHNDVLIAEGTATNSSVWMFLWRTGSFDNQPSKGFWSSKITGTSLGNSLAVGDFDNNGKLDFAAGDNAASPGRIVVWHP